MSKGRPTNHVKTSYIIFETQDQTIETYYIKQKPHKIIPEKIVDLRLEKHPEFKKSIPIQKTDVKLNVDVGTQTCDDFYINFNILEPQRNVRQEALFTPQFVSYDEIAQKLDHQIDEQIDLSDFQYSA